MIESKLIITDLHGCLWKRRKGGPSLHSTRGLTEGQVDILFSQSLEELKPWKVMTPLASDRIQVLGRGWGSLNRNSPV